MGQYRSAIGTITGSVGDLTFTTWKGKKVVKQKVARNNTSASPAQVAQRTRFAAIAALTGALAPVIRVGFNDEAAQETAQNVFQRRNADRLTELNGVFTPSYSELEISSGPVAPIAGLELGSAGAGGNYAVTWSNNSNGSSALPTDRIFLAVFSRNSGTARAVDTGRTRADLNMVGAVLASEIAAGGVIVIGFAKRADSTQCSPTAAALPGGD